MQVRRVTTIPLCRAILLVLSRGAGASTRSSRIKGNECVETAHWNAYPLFRELRPRNTKQGPETRAKVGTSVSSIEGKVPLLRSTIWKTPIHISKFGLSSAEQASGAFDWSIACVERRGLRAFMTWL
jgi:hypothetical protein